VQPRDEEFEGCEHAVEEPAFIRQRVLSDSAAALEDPLDNLLKLFQGQGIELSEQLCLTCFDNDPGRVRRSQTADDSFVVYKSDDPVDFFQVITHVFNPQRMDADFAVRPFSFFGSHDRDEDGEPDAWEPLTPQYEKLGSTMGWEKGVFSADFGSRPFLKISLLDFPGSWRPQIGNVVLLPGLSEMTWRSEPESEGSESGGSFSGVLETGETVDTSASGESDAPAPQRPAAGEVIVNQRTDE
jgi:hypothetical protein